VGKGGRKGGLKAERRCALRERKGSGQENNFLGILPKSLWWFVGGVGERVRVTTMGVLGDLKTKCRGGCPGKQSGDVW